MREILFRGKRVDNGEWVYGDLCHGEYGKVFILYDNDAVITSKKNELTSWGFIEVDPETIGQYTGMIDRNGNKIFEGDLLEFDEILGEHYWLEIEKDDKPPHNFIMGYIKKPDANIRGMCDGMFTILEDLPISSRIIGNIHDEGEN